MINLRLIDLDAERKQLGFNDRPAAFDALDRAITAIADVASSNETVLALRYYAGQAQHRSEPSVRAIVESYEPVFDK